MRWNFRQGKIGRERENEPTYRNPLFAKGSWKFVVIEHFGFFSWLFALILLVALYAVFYSPLFQITDVRISGTTSISPSLLKEKYVGWQLAQRKGFIFRQNNLWLFSTTWLKSNLERDFSFSSLIIDKKIPHTLLITIEERRPSLVWVVGEVYYLLGNSGQIVSVAATKDEATGLPLIYDESNSPTKPGDQLFDQAKVTFIQTVVNKLQEIPALEVTSYSMPNNSSTRLTVKTKAGYAIYFDTSNSLDSQIAKLIPVLAEKVGANAPKEYIDLSFGEGRVYLK